MAAPTGIMKEDWSMGAHFLAEVYEEQPDVEAFISALYAGTAGLADNAKWNAKMDAFDTLMQYNYAAASEYGRRNQRKAGRRRFQIYVH